MNDLLHESIYAQAQCDPEHLALAAGQHRASYAELAGNVERAAAGLTRLGLRPDDRVAVYLNKRLETVAALFGAMRAGAVMVPVNPLLKPSQVAHILIDSGARVLVTAGPRLEPLAPELGRCPALRAVVVVDPAESDAGGLNTGAGDTVSPAGPAVVSWDALESAPAGFTAPRRIDTDLAAILYTSGSTGRPKGVVLSHRNMVAGARSVASYLANVPSDRILSVLPLSFDAGFSQLTTGFHAGATVHLINYLLPKDVINAAQRYAITGITAVPPLWIPLARLPWTAGALESMRYIANTGGAMPRATLAALRQALPRTRVFLMYGLTEAFRSTVLAPEELDRRPDSIGKAIPNAEVLVVRPDGTLCDADEPGELVHRGALVAQGYWNDPQGTAEHFKPAPARPGQVPITEMAVWSGDTVRRDTEGFLYFVGRGDDMIKTSGYRVSPSEVEAVLYASTLVAEAVAVGVPHPVLGHGLVVSVVPADPDTFSAVHLLAVCRARLPNFMVPARIDVRDRLPRNPNGKLDRRSIADSLAGLFDDEPP